MRKYSISAVDIIVRDVVTNLSCSIHKNLYCGEICIKAIEKRCFEIRIKSIYGVKFTKLIVDMDPEVNSLRFRIYHDWYTQENNSSVEKPIKTILVNNLGEKYIEKDEFKYIINYFSEASRNNYKHFRDNLSVLHKGKKSFWNYLKYWFKWPRKNQSNSR